MQFILFNANLTSFLYSLIHLTTSLLCASLCDYFSIVSLTWQPARWWGRVTAGPRVYCCSRTRRTAHTSRIRRPQGPLSMNCKQKLVRTQSAWTGAISTREDSSLIIKHRYHFLKNISYYPTKIKNTFWWFLSFIVIVP